MANGLFDIFLRDAPVEVSAALEAAGMLDEVDAMTFRRSGDEYTVVVRHRGDWFMEKGSCKPPKNEEDEQPRMRAVIDGIAERMVAQIGAVA